MLRAGDSHTLYQNKCHILYMVFLFIIFILLPYQSQAYGTGCEQYGFMSYPDGFGYCKCMSGYTFGKNFLGQTTCINVDTDCQNRFGYNAKYSYLSNSCECKEDYFVQNNQCVSGSLMCSNKYGVMVTYNSLSNSCECMSGYEFSQSLLGGLYCQSCTSKLGSYASYNFLTKSCECRDGYTLKDGKCVEKQNNAYFLLKELSTDDRLAIIKSEYTNINYLINYSLGCYGSVIDRYVNKDIVVNMGTDFDVDVSDMIVLYNDDETCDIRSVKIVSENYTLNPEPIVYIPISPLSSNQSVISSVSLVSSSDRSKYIKQQKNLVKSIDSNLSNRLKGKILLQVEENGEGWYVNPDNSKRLYLGTREDAFNIMRTTGLGISEKDFNNFNSKAPVRLAGKILLRVEAHGEGYYVNPTDLSVNYMPTPEDAFQIMRKFGLGITNNDIQKIDIEEL